MIAGLTARASAAIFNIDDRQAVSTAPGSPYSPIGLVRRRGLSGRYTTGTLVDECHVLTSQHIFGNTASPIGKRLQFTGAVGTEQQLSSPGTVVAAGGLEQHRSANQRSEARGSDWLLVRLDTCIGKMLGYAKLREGPKTPFELTHVQSAGYPLDRNSQSGLTIDPSCRVTAVYTLVWLNDCAALQGNSGGPIFVVSTIGGTQRLEVFAIQSAAIMQKQPIAELRGWENLATPTSIFAPQVQRSLRAAAGGVRTGDEPRATP